MRKESGGECGRGKKKGGGVGKGHPKRRGGGGGKKKAKGQLHQRKEKIDNKTISLFGNRGQKEKGKNYTGGTARLLKKKKSQTTLSKRRGTGEKLGPANLKDKKKKADAKTLGGRDMITARRG